MNWIIATFRFHSVLCSLRLWKQKFSLQQSQSSRTTMAPGRGMNPFVSVCQGMANPVDSENTFLPFDFHWIRASKQQGQQQQKTIKTTNQTKPKPPSPPSQPPLIDVPLPTVHSDHLEVLVKCRFRFSGSGEGSEIPHV